MKQKHHTVASKTHKNRDTRALFEAIESRILLSAATVTMAAPTAVSSTSATLHATVNPNGSATSVSFQYSADPVFPATNRQTFGSVAAPWSIAVDAVGDAFIADNGSNGHDIKELLTNGTVNTITNAISSPGDVVVNTAGDLFVSDTSTGTVKEILPNGTINTIASGFSLPIGVAVDTAGDVFVADAGHNAVKEILTNGTINTIGSGLSAPENLAVDSSGDVFVGDANGIEEILPNHTTTVSITTSDYAPAVDNAGDIFCASDTGNTVQEILPDHTTVRTLAYGFIRTIGIAVDGAGDVFVADNGDYLSKFAPQSINASPSSLTGNSATSVTATLTNLVPNTTYYERAVTSGPSGFAVGSSGSFTTPAIPPTVTMAAATAVSTTGATLNATVNANNSVSSVSFQYSTDPGFTNATQETIGSGLSSPSGVAVDAAGDVFVGDEGNNQVKEILPNGTSNIIGSNFEQPEGVAVDASGDVFVADTGNAAVKEILPDGTVNSIGSGFSLPVSVAVNSAGDVFVADFISGDIYEISSSGATTTFLSGLNRPSGVAVDSNGDVFVADTYDNRVEEVHPNGTITTIGSGFSRPTGVAVDAAGDVLVTNFGNATVQEVLSSGTIRNIGSGFSQPVGVAVDTGGDIYIADLNSTQLGEISSSSGGRTFTASPASVNGTTATDVSLPLTGLISGDTYYYRAVATNSAGTTFGTVLSFAVTSTSTPILTVSAAGGVYSGSPIAAGAMVSGTNGIAGTSLERVTPTLTYYAGSSATTTPLPGAPVDAGTYTVVATFAGSADYNMVVSSPVTFTITPAMAQLNVTGSTALFDGNSHGATLAVIAANATDSASLASLIQTSYKNVVTGVITTTAPVSPGVYSVLASFAGNNDYAPIPTYDTANTIVISPFATLPTLSASGPSTHLSGTIAVASLIKNGVVTVTANGVAKTIKVNKAGQFSGTLNTGKLAAGNYTIQYKYAGPKGVGATTWTVPLIVSNKVSAVPPAKHASTTGTTIPVAIKVTNLAGKALASTTVVTAIGIASQSTPGTVVPLPGGSDVSDLFTLNKKHQYQLGLSTTGLAAGQYVLTVSVAGDPMTHSISFTVGN